MSSTNCHDTAEDPDALEIFVESDEFNFDESELEELAGCNLSEETAVIDDGKALSKERVASVAPVCKSLNSSRYLDDISSDDEETSEGKSRGRGQKKRRKISTTRSPRDSPVFVEGLEGKSLVPGVNRTANDEPLSSDDDESMPEADVAVAVGKSLVPGVGTNPKQPSKLSVRGTENAGTTGNLVRTQGASSPVIHINKHFRGSVRAAPGTSLAWDPHASSGPVRTPSRALAGASPLGLRPVMRFRNMPHPGLIRGLPFPTAALLMPNRPLVPPIFAHMGGFPVFRPGLSQSVPLAPGYPLPLAPGMIFRHYAGAPLREQILRHDLEAHMAQMQNMSHKRRRPS